MDFFYTYVLRSSKDGKFYMGYTSDLKRRLQEHLRGKNVSTAKRLPLELVFYEAFRSEEDARRREEYFKTTKGKVALRLMLKEYLRNWN